MKEFPRRLRVANKDQFPSYHYERVLCYLRKEIFEHMIKEYENTYFELDKFSKTYLKGDTDLINKMKDTVVAELQELGWNCKTSFGGTGLFVYSTDDPPPSCHEDGF